MEYSRRETLYPPQSPIEPHSSRISIGALLNPSGDNNSDTSSIPPTSPLPHDSYHYYQQQQQHHYSSHPYQQSHYHSSRNLSNGQGTDRQMGGYSDYPQPPRSTSVNSSPGLYPRERFPSVSSSSSAIVERRRPPRPKYDEEEMYFIWYHRVDLRQEWKEVRESFNAQFPNRQRNGFQGIQCKYYRFIKEKNCPTLREQRRRRSGGGSGGNGSGNASSGSDGNSDGNFNEDLPQYGVIRWTNMRFPWMKEYRSGAA